MVSYAITPDTLYQYCAVIPYGNTVEDCLCEDSLRIKLMNTREVMILGRHGQLFGLNMTGALIVEAIIEGKGGKEILEILIRHFAGSVEQAMEMQRDYLEITGQLEMAGYIEKQ